MKNRLLLALLAPCLVCFAAEGKPSPHDEILLNTEAARGAIRVGDWKLVLNGGVEATTGEEDGESAARKGRKGSRGQGNPATIELFNLSSDPYEKKNLASTNPEKVKELRTRYDRLAAQAATPRTQSPVRGFKSTAVWGEFQ